MGALLDRLERQAGTLWLACIAWAFVWGFAPRAYHFVAWPIVLGVALIGALVLFDYFARDASLREALHLQGLKRAPGTGERSLGYLQLGSAALMLQAALAGQDTSALLPLFLSGMLPEMLKSRRDEEAFLRPPQTAG